MIPDSVLKAFYSISYRFLLSLVEMLCVSIRLDFFYLIRWHKANNNNKHQAFMVIL